MEPQPDTPLLPDAAAAFASVFDAPLPVTDWLTLDDVRRFVTGRIAALLDRRPEYLMHVLYRVDVAEADVKAVFESAPPDEIAARLADLLVERQMEKLRLRRRYARPGPT